MYSKPIKRITRYLSAILFILVFSADNKLVGQDFHYSQFYNAPFTVNPALTGIFNGDERVVGSIRDQWRSIDVPWFNFSLGYDRKFYPRKSNKGFFGAGASFNYDTQGDSKLQLSNINLSGSYTRVLNKTNLIGIGGMIGFASRAFNPDNLTWDRQWDPATFTLGTGSSGENFEFQRFSFLETSLGLNYRWQKTARRKLDIGIAGYHLTTPSSRFYAGTIEESLPIRFSISGIFSRELTDKLDLQLDALYQRQDVYNEFVGGGYLNFYLNQNRGKEFQFRAGLGYRTRQAIFPKIGLEFNNLFVAASYDIYINDTSRDHGGGGPELHIRYIIKHVKPLGKFKVCPIY